MDKTVYIIGDSHTQSLEWAYPDSGYENTNTKFIFTRLVAKTAFNLNYSVENLIDISQYSNLIIMPYLGEVDVRYYLSKRKNARNVAYQYVHKTIKKFPNYRIIFLCPVPPSSKYIKQDEFNGSYLERMNAYNEFIFYLKKYSLENELEEPIDIRNAFDEYSIKDRIYVEDGYHLDADYLTKIFDYIVKKI